MNNEALLMLYDPGLWAVIDHIVLISVEIGVVYAWGYFDGHRDERRKK